MCFEREVSVREQLIRSRPAMANSPGLSVATEIFIIRGSEGSDINHMPGVKIQSRSDLEGTTSLPDVNSFPRKTASGQNKWFKSLRDNS